MFSLFSRHRHGDIDDLFGNFFRGLDMPFFGTSSGLPLP
jgi:hypothetical protein